MWRGSAFGGVKGRTELPGIVDEAVNGQLDIDPYITHRASHTRTASQTHHTCHVHLVPDCVIPIA